MIGALALIFAGLAPQAPTVSPQGSNEVLAEIRVHGNHITTDEEVLKLSGLKVGDKVTATTVADVTARLRASKKFDDVTVLKRYASISDLNQITIVIIVNEGPVRIEMPTIPGIGGGAIKIVRRRGYHNLMWLPILDAEDGYGVTFGVRFALVGTMGKRTRLSFPLTWGGTKQAGAELDRVFTKGPVSRISIGGDVWRRRNPAFLLNDDRRRVWGRVEKGIGPIRGGATLGYQRVSFAGATDRLRTIGGDIAIDTRVDPFLPRNAVYAKTSIERVRFSAGDSTYRTRLDGNVYIGVYRQTVLELRAVREDANRPLPPYLKSLLGGWSSLRGFRAGAFIGDTAVHTTAELRIPLSSPLKVAKLGVSAFMDAGTAYDKGARFRDQTMHEGIGGSVWITATVFRMSVSVAHGRGAGTRANFGIQFSF